jgi:hypothetical protein
MDQLAMPGLPCSAWRGKRHHNSTLIVCTQDECPAALQMAQPGVPASRHGHLVLSHYKCNKRSQKGLSDKRHHLLAKPVAQHFLPECNDITCLSLLQSENHVKPLSCLHVY